MEWKSSDISVEQFGGDTNSELWVFTSAFQPTRKTLFVYVSETPHSDYLFSRLLLDEDSMHQKKEIQHTWHSCNFVFSCLARTTCGTCIHTEIHPKNCDILVSNKHSCCFFFGKCKENSNMLCN